MNFYSVRDLESAPRNVWNDLAAEGEVIITEDGKPAALMFDISDGGFEETIKAVRQVKAMLAFNSMRQKAASSGYMTDEEIEAEIAAARRETE